MLHLAGCHPLALEPGQLLLPAGDGDLAGAVILPHPERDFHALVHIRRAHPLGDGIAHAIARDKVQHGRVRGLTVEHIGGGCGSGPVALAGNKVHQIVHMHHVAAGKHAGNAGLHILVDHGSLGVGVHH